MTILNTKYCYHLDEEVNADGEGNDRMSCMAQFLEPMDGRGQMPKPQHPTVRVSRNRQYFTPSLTHSHWDDDTNDGEKVWVDRCANPSTPEWLQRFDVKAGQFDAPDGEYNLFSNIRYRPINANPSTAFMRDILGNSNIDFRRSLANKSLMTKDEIKDASFEFLDETWKAIASQAEFIAREWVVKHAIKEVPLTVVQAIGTDADSSTVYGRVFQPNGASDTDGWCREGLTQRLLLAFHSEHAAEVQRGDIFLVWARRWISADSRIFDCMKESGCPPPTWMPTDDRCWLSNDDMNLYNESVDDAINLPRVYGSGMALEIEGKEVRHMIHPSRSNAFGFWMANKLFSELAMNGEISSGGLEAISESIPDMFIPAFKDKRKPKVIDMASPHYAHYHDEIRCPECNGRVLIKARADNIISEADCPHCKKPKAIKFPHLTNTTIKSVGVNE